MVSEFDTVVIDNGSGMCKAGFGGEDAPRTAFPAIIGRAKHDSVMATTGQKDFYVGDEAQSKRGVLTLRYPVKNGIVTDWQEMRAIWAHALYNELRVNPENASSLLTEAPMNPKKNREKMADIFLADFNAPRFYIAIQAVLSLYSDGRTTGLVLDSGDGVSHTVPIYEGFALQHAIMRLDLAGSALTDYLQKLLVEHGCNLATSAEREVVRDIKEKMCYVAVDFDEEMAKYKHDESAFEFIYELPDKTSIDIKGTSFQAPECLFKPSLVGMEADGMGKMVHETVKRSDLDVRQDMLSGIVLSGGTTLTKDIEKRLLKEVKDRVSTNAKVKVIASNNRKFSVWIGGSILSSLNTFETCWITKEEYEEAGSSIVHRKCF